MDEDEFDKLKLYLPPALGQDAPYLKNMICRYLESEFPEKGTATNLYYIPKMFNKQGEKQAMFAEQLVYERLKGLVSLNLPDLWILFFHSTSYGGYSKRNQSIQKLIIRENDFVVFIKYQGKYYVQLIEVKSTCDSKNLTNLDLELTADSKIVKNNKRSAQHQLRDHKELLENVMGSDITNKIQYYVIWPFLSDTTKDPKNQIIKRWAEDGKLHVFENSLTNQTDFNEWFYNCLISGSCCSQEPFYYILNRYIVLSCGIFMDEIDRNHLALLTQEQLDVLKHSESHHGVMVVHGIAGTGKTLLILKKMQLLHEAGELNENNRGLFVCYWPGIRCDVDNKLQAMGLKEYIDTTRFYISLEEFLKNNDKCYKHIFMDEAEATVLSYTPIIKRKTFYQIYRAYHHGNCSLKDKCQMVNEECFQKHTISELIEKHSSTQWGHLWFMVDTNQTLMPIPKHSSQILKTPQVVLNKLIRSTSDISILISRIMHNQSILSSFPKYDQEPPIFWITRTFNITQTVSNIIVDLCTTKGVQPCDICVIPFLQNELLTVDAINSQICQIFVEKAYHPQAVKNVEHFLTLRNQQDFLVAWALLVKGLEFKVVVMVIDEEQFDQEDQDDWRRMYVICSRCTCMLIVVSDVVTKKAIGLNGLARDYKFNIKMA